MVVNTRVSLLYSILSLVILLHGRNRKKGRRWCSLSAEDRNSYVSTLLIVKRWDVSYCSRPVGDEKEHDDGVNLI